MSEPVSAGDNTPTLPPHRPGAEEAVTLPPSPPNGTSAAPVSGTADAPSVPGYEVLGELGRGGMGVVYKARQAGLNRLVALKMILAGEHAGEDALARFRGEAEAVARLRHANIVQVYEVGEWRPAGAGQSLPFFSLEFVEGGSLAERLAGTPLPAGEAARLAEPLARAMHAAHQAGIIHRDLKPANVLLTDDGTPKVTDFGLARKLEEQGRTQTGSILGTPSYMAPEQAGGKNKEVGPHTDVYALGAVLYECLTGRPPFRAATPLDTVLQVLSEEPVPPRRLQPKVPRDLETICLKCLHKDPRRRYATALALADDLKAFREGRPITARPVGRLERGWRWCKRNPLLAAVAAVAAVLALVIAVGAPPAIFGLQALNRDLKATVYSQSVGLAHREWQEGNINRARDLLEGLAPARRGWEWDYVHSLLGAHLYEARHDRSVPAYAVAFSPDSNLLAVAHANGTVRIHDIASGAVRDLTGLGRPLREGENGTLAAVAFAPGLKLLAAAEAGGAIRILDPATGQTVQMLAGHGKKVIAQEFSRDGSRLACLEEGQRARLWDLTAGKEVAELSFDFMPTEMALAPDGRRLAVTSWESGPAQFWDVGAKRRLAVVRAPVQAGTAAHLAWRPDGRVLATTHNADSSIRLWDIDTGREVCVLRGHPTGIFGLTFGPDGRYLASVGGTQSVILWDTATGQEVRRYHGHADVVQCCAFTPGGAGLATADSKGQVEVWDATAAQDATVLDSAELATGLAFSPDGHRVAAGLPNMVRIWDEGLGWGWTSLPQPGRVLGVAFHPDGRRLATAADDKLVRVWDTAAGKVLFQLEGHPEKVLAVAWSPDGRSLASAGSDGTVILWDAEARRERLRLNVPVRRDLQEKLIRRWIHLAFSPDGRRLAVGCWAQQDGMAQVFNAETGAPVGPELRLPWNVSGLTFSPDGRRLQVANQEGRLLERTLPDGPVTTHWFRGQMYGNMDAVLFPDGSRFASIDEAGTVKVWDFASGRELLTLNGLRNLGWIAVSPDGMRLAAVSVGGGPYGTIRVWDAAEAAPQARRSTLLGRVLLWHREQAFSSHAVEAWPAVLFHLGYLERAGALDDFTRGLKRDAEAHVGKAPP